MPVLEINNQKVEAPIGWNTMSQAQKDAWVDDVASDMGNRKAQDIMSDIERYGRYLERQDQREAVANMGNMEQFLQSASVQANKFGLGVKDAFGFGDEQANQEQARRLEQYNTALAEEAPTANFLGRTVGGIASTTPLIVGAEASVPAGLGWLGRLALSGVSGMVEGGLEMPFSNESRTSNTVMSGIGGVVSEPVANVLSATLKQIPFGALNPNRASQIEQRVRETLDRLGYNYDNFKPETKQILNNISGAEDIDAAVKEAMETEFGFALTKGEATQDFAQISNERGASRMSDDAGDMMRDFKDKQNTDITNAAGALAEDAGGTVGDYQQMGAVLKEALSDARNIDRANYKELYDEAGRIAAENNIDIPLPPEAIADEFYRLARDHMNTDGNMLKDIGNKLAQYGILDPDQFKTDMPFSIPDVDLQRLGVSNSEDFIKYLNSLYSSDPRANMILGRLKDAVEANADETLANALKEGGADKTAKQFLDAARQARQANKAYRDLWDAKDVLQDITGVKPNTNTPLKDASEVVALLRRKPENARRVIEELGKRGNDAAVADLRTFMLKDLFETALNPNVPSGSGKGFFSGSKLTTAINKNDAVLREVLTPDQYAQLKAFEVEVGKATKVPDGAVNYSNSGYKVVEFLMRLLKATPILNPLSNIQQYSAERAVREAVQGGREPIDYIMKLDQNHIKLNALIRHTLDQAVFDENSALSE